jgi:hypothetical protein
MLFQRCPAPARASRKTSGKRAPEKRAPPTMQAGASEEPVPRNASVRVRRRARHRDRFPRPHRAPALPLPLTRLLTLPLPLPLVHSQGGHPREWPPGEARHSHRAGRRDARRWPWPTEFVERPTPPQGGEPERRRDERRTRRQAGLSKYQPRNRHRL